MLPSMKTYVLFGLLVIANLHGSLNGEEDVETTSYKAAVVEYSSGDFKADSTPFHFLRSNVDNYVRYIEEASNKGVDIIIFPQYGLTSRDILDKDLDELDDFAIVVPRKDELVVPCLDSMYHRVLHNLSCAADKGNVYVVVQLLEKDITMDRSYFNTMIVFDRNGQLIAKYQSIHAGNADIKNGYNVERFGTDFGVNFGLIMGNDIFYKTAIWDVFSNSNVSNVIAAMAWKSEAPFLTALSVQAGYSRAAGVNLLVAGLNDPKNKYGGSGIYYYNGKIAELYISPSKSSKLLIQNVPKIARRMPAVKCQNNSNEMPRFRLGGSLNVGVFFTDTENMENYTFAKLARFSPRTVRRVCSAEDRFCCDFNITVSVKEDTEDKSNDEPVYKLVAFHGRRAIGEDKKHIGIRTCAVVACEDNDVSTCGSMTTMRRSHIKFENIQIKATFQNNRHTYDWPVTATYDLIPLTEYTYCEELRENHRNEFPDDMQQSVSQMDNINFFLPQQVYIEMLTTQPIENLLVYGIWGRTFNNDDRRSLGVLLIEEMVAGLSRNVIMIIILCCLIFLIALVIAVKCIKRSYEHKFEAIPTK